MTFLAGAPFDQSKVSLKLLISSRSPYDRSNRSLWSIEGPSARIIVLSPTSFSRASDLFYVILMISMTSHSHPNSNNFPHVNGYGFTKLNSKYNKQWEQITNLRCIIRESFILELPLSEYLQDLIEVVYIIYRIVQPFSVSQP